MPDWAISFIYGTDVGAYAAVPNVIGADADGAEANLKDLGLNLNIIGKEENRKVVLGTITVQSPKWNEKLVKGTDVSVTVSAGVETALVPDVMYMTEELATQYIEDVGLKVKVAEIETEEYAAGVVVKQSADAGKQLELGETVTISISKGMKVEKGKVKMPTLVGLTFEEASGILRELGLYPVKAQIVYDSKLPVGAIASQEIPANDEVKKGSAVRVTVNEGIKQVRVPDVQYMTKEDASARLKNLGLEVELVEEKSTTVSEGLVLGQSVAAESIVDTGTKITLRVSIGDSIDVPNVVGVKYGSAVETLRGAGFNVSINRIESNDVAKDYVISQSATRAKSGSTIVINVSLGKSNVTIFVPNVTGISRANAQSKLNDSGLGSSVTETYSETVPQGSVISQNPPQGTEVTKGYTVALTVSLGSEYRQVPGVVSSSLGNAQSAIAAVGLGSSVSEAYNDNVPAGVVISQSIAAGQKVKIGTTVALVVSNGSAPVTVPSVVGMSQSSAVSAIESAQLVCSVSQYYNQNNTDAYKGQVTSQSVSGGSSTAKWTTVIIYVDLGREIISIPNVTGMSQSQAQSTLASYGFGCTVGASEHNNGISRGLVSHQSPSIGTNAYRGDTVTIYPSKGTSGMLVTSADYNAYYSNTNDYSATPYYRYQTKVYEYNSTQTLSGWNYIGAETTGPSTGSWGSARARGTYTDGDYIVKETEETLYRYYVWMWYLNGGSPYYASDSKQSCIDRVNAYYPDQSRRNTEINNYIHKLTFGFTSDQGGNPRVNGNSNEGYYINTNFYLYREGYQYRITTTKTTYKFWAWGSYCDWTENHPNGSEYNYDSEIRYWVVGK